MADKDPTLAEAEAMFNYANSQGSVTPPVSTPRQQGLGTAPVRNDSPMVPPRPDDPVGYSDIDTAMFAEADKPASVQNKSLADREAAWKSALDSGQTSIDPLSTMLMSAGDTLSFGTFDKLIATLNTASDSIDILTGKKSLSTSWIENYEDAILAQRAARYANPGFAIAGDVAGSFGSGAATGKAMLEAGSEFFPRALGYLGSRNVATKSLLAGTMAGTEAAVYSLNKNDGNLEKAAVDAGVAFIGGAAISGLLQGGASAVKNLFNVVAPEAAQLDVGTQVLRMVNLGRAPDAQLKPSDLASMLNTAPEGTTLLDLFPSLSRTAKDLFKSLDTAEQAQNLAGLVATRADFMEDLVDPNSFLKKLITTPGVRSPDQMNEIITKSFKDLQPQYTAVLEANKNVRFKVTNVINDIVNVFGADQARWSPAEAEAVADMIAAVRAAQKRNGKAAKTITVENLLGLTKDASKKLDTLYNGRNPTTHSRELGRAYSLMDNMLTAKLSKQVPDYGVLQRTYGTEASRKRAYEAAKEYLSYTATDRPTLDLFLTNRLKSDADKAAFAEGLKYELFTRLNAATKNEGASVSTAFEKVLLKDKRLAEKLGAVLGDDNVKAFVDSVKPTVAMAKTADTIKTVLSKGQSLSRPDAGKIVQTLMDLGILASGSRGAQGGAARRIATSGVPELAATTDVASAQVADTLLGTPGYAGAQQMNALQTLFDKVVPGGTAKNLLQSSALGAALSSVLSTTK